MPTKRTGSIGEDAVEPEAPPEEAEAEEVVSETPEVDALEDEDEFEDEDGAVPLEELDPEEDLWLGGPKIGQVLEWKKEYGEVWCTTLNPFTNRHVLWRPLDRDEYRRLVLALEQAIQAGMSNVEATMNNEEVMTELVTLYPKYNRHDRKGTLAGMPQTISQEVMEMSGFVAVEVRQL